MHEKEEREKTQRNKETRPKRGSPQKKTSGPYALKKENSTRQYFIQLTRGGSRCSVSEFTYCRHGSAVEHQTGHLKGDGYLRYGIPSASHSREKRTEPTKLKTKRESRREKKTQLPSSHKRLIFFLLFSPDTATTANQINIELAGT